eukprot:TRINITY_DN7154_c0_g1_i1.p1 TRINITY_DN7154_c0_g1~~TRINITY_DN7154_c0_g1_i1.p1  ORF type:complete len:649 (+),score=111.84 TRINITY_DN7154_c0_g1_i1:83-1948(+)
MAAAFDAETASLRSEAVPLTGESHEDLDAEVGSAPAASGAAASGGIEAVRRAWPAPAGGWHQRRGGRYFVSVATVAGLAGAALYALANVGGAQWARAEESSQAYAGLGQQCGGKGWTGSTECAAGFVCRADSEEYSECKEDAFATFAEPYDYCRWSNPDGSIAEQPCPESLTCTPVPDQGDRSVCLPDRLKHAGEECIAECKAPGDCLWCGAGNACCKMGAEHDPPECAGVSHFLTNHYECVVPAHDVPVKHQGQDCWGRCLTGGSCSWCGEGNACCRANEKNDPPECGGVTEFSAWNHHVCVAPVHPQRVQHAGEDCWKACHDVAGFCDFCGSGNACCRKGFGWPKECMGDIDFPRKDVHTCVAPVQQGCAPGTWEAGGACIEPNKPITIDFYVYTVDGGNADDMTNANVFSLAGLFWHLHTQVVTTCPRQGGATKIQRYKLVMHNPATLYETDHHHRFGPYIDFTRSANCTDPKCAYYLEEFGSAVGCQPLSDSVARYEPSPTMYSLPGTSCSREPDGTDGCTWRLEPAGQLLLDELVGIEDHAAFCEIGNQEYDPFVDRGEGLSFWDYRANPSRCKWRLHQFQKLMKEKHPDAPVWIGEPTCDRPLLLGGEAAVGLNR